MQKSMMSSTYTGGSSFGDLARNEIYKQTSEIFAYLPTRG